METEINKNLPFTQPHKSHSFHLVNPSPWPILTAFALLMLATGGVLFFHYKHFLSDIVLGVGLLAVISCAYLWWQDVIKEGREDKAHTLSVQQGLRIGMALFILSEVMFFGAFFGSLFKAMLAPVAVLDGVWPASPGVWPPKNIKTFDPWNIPFMNTLILLLSGTTVTWAHYSLISRKNNELIQALGLTVLLGLAFSSMQALEYFDAPFKFKEGIYPSNFYMATGFHGFHVIIGTIFLYICYIRAKKGHFINTENSLGLEFAAWYWHFVDVVWLFLYVFVYILGS
jgi:cytochrome c oxidase subunit 3